MDRSKWKKTIKENWSDRSSDSDAESCILMLYVSDAGSPGLPGFKPVKQVCFVVCCCTFVVVVCKMKVINILA